MFADDTRTYLHCLCGEERIREIGHWMSAIRLNLNTDKAQIVWTGSRHNLSLLGGCGPSLQLGDDVIKYERGLYRLMHDDLHWLVIPQQVQYASLL